MPGSVKIAIIAADAEPCMKHRDGCEESQSPNAEPGVKHRDGYEENRNLADQKERAMAFVVGNF